MRMRDAGKPISRPTLSDYQLGTAHEQVFKLVAEAARGRAARRYEVAMDGLFDTNTDESARMEIFVASPDNLVAREL